MSKLQQAAKTIATLKTQMLALKRYGLGREVLSAAEEFEIEQALEEYLDEVFGLYARVQVAQALGITNVFLSVLGVSQNSEE
jgi:hypothetical protein